jgi:hypothetical protein
MKRITFNKVNRKTKLLAVIGVLISLFFNGYLLKMYIDKPVTVERVEKNVIEVEMDKSCYDQFKNNMDKTIYVKLNFK